MFYYYVPSGFMLSAQKASLNFNIQTKREKLIIIIINRFLYFCSPQWGSSLPVTSCQRTRSLVFRKWTMIKNMGQFKIIFFCLFPMFGLVSIVCLFLFLPLSCLEIYLGKPKNMSNTVDNNKSKREFPKIQVLEPHSANHSYQPSWTQ